MLVIHHLRVFATSNAQTIFQIFLYGSMQFFMGFLKMKSEFWYRVISVDFCSRYWKKVKFQKSNFCSADFLVTGYKAIIRSLLSSFVENYFLYLLRPAEAQTVKVMLRKLKNTKNTQFSRKMCTFSKVLSVFGS